MGRAGRGSSGGGSRSSGSRSISRSSGGHRSSGSTRAGRSSFSSGPGNLGGYRGGYRSPRPPRYPRHYGYGRNRTVYVRENGPASTLSTVLAYGIVLIIVLLMFAPTIFGMFGNGGNVSTIERHKLESGNTFYTNCITDELGWFDNEAKTESRLKDFYKETGVQPIIVFKSYDPTIKTDSQKETWANTYYDKNIDREDAFLYVYFGEANENDVGYMCYVNGYETSSVMDQEAVSIFWNNIDRYWYTDLSTDDVMVKAFNDTADTIMKVSTTGKDIVKWVIVAAVVIGGGFIIVKIMKKKREGDAAEAAETERILNTPLEKMEDTADDLAEKYNQ